MSPLDQPSPSRDKIIVTEALRRRATVMAERPIGRSSATRATRSLMS